MKKILAVIITVAMFLSTATAFSLSKTSYEEQDPEYIVSTCTDSVFWHLLTGVPLCEQR